MGNGSIGTQGSIAFIIPTWFSGSWVCPNCGRSIAKRYIAIIRHQNCCTGKMKKINKWAQKGSKHKNKNIKFIFYDNCRVHALTEKEMAEYISVGLRTLQRRTKDNWTLRQLLKKDTPPDNCKGGNPTGKNTHTPEEMNEKQKSIQNLLMRKIK